MKTPPFLAWLGLNAHILFLFLALLTPSRLLAVSGPPPITNSPSSSAALDTWSFGNTNTWQTDLGYYPISFTNLQVSGLSPGISLLIDSTDSAWLQYETYQTGGATNLNVTSAGSLVFWFAPNWASANDTNETGYGPGVAGRLLEIGTNATHGWWSLYFDTGGTNLYFSAESNNAVLFTYLSAPVTFDSNVWHLVALTWSSANTALFVDGACLTNGPGISVLPNSTVIDSGFTIGSDAGTGMLQMHGALNELATYGYQISSEYISTTWMLNGIFYFRNPDNLANFDNPPYDPGLSDIYDVVSGPGYLQVIGTNTTTCFASSNVWITNAVASPGTNGAINLSFMVTGGNADLPYDVFATTALVEPRVDTVWSWMGQAYPCETNVIYGLTNRAVYLLLGTPQDSDGDGLTDAFEFLITHTDPDNPSSSGDGIADGFKILAGLSLTSEVAVPSLAATNCPVCPE